MNRAISAAILVCNAVRVGALAAADTIIDLSMLRTGGRPKPGTRTNWRPGLKEQLARAQGGMCVYCRYRLDLSVAYIDHMMPVIRGGGNDESNLQVLCPGCNILKSDRSDQEFRPRYRKVLGQRPRGMPPRRISRAEYDALRRATEDVEIYRRFNAGKYLTPSQKVNAAALATGVGMAFLVFVPLNWVFDPGDASSLLLSSLAIGGMAGVGIRLRAWRTGKDRED